MSDKKGLPSPPLQTLYTLIRPRAVKHTGGQGGSQCPALARGGHSGTRAPPTPNILSARLIRSESAAVPGGIATNEGRGGKMPGHIPNMAARGHRGRLAVVAVPCPIPFEARYLPLVVVGVKTDVILGNHGSGQA